MNTRNFNKIVNSINKLYIESDNIGGIPQTAGISPGLDNGQSQMIVFPSTNPVQVDKEKSSKSDVLKDICNKIEEKVIKIKGKLNTTSLTIQTLEQIDQQLNRLC